jgi:hypothetical protein
MVKVAGEPKKKTGHPAKIAEEPNLPLPRVEEDHQKKNADTANEMAKVGAPTAGPSEEVDCDENPDNEDESEKDPARRCIRFRWRRDTI